MRRPVLIESAIWSRLESEARLRARANEAAHDFYHVERVVANARYIGRKEELGVQADAIVAIAALLHELFVLPKHHPDSPRAGDACADNARELLVRERVPAEMIEPVCNAIRDHGFSKGVVPDALESRVLQDADRLDALGAIGLARLWSTSAEIKRPFYSPEDPFCTSRLPDDKAWGLDHVFRKLLKIPERLHTETARALAVDRIAFLKQYLDQLKREISAAGPSL